jgi:hypothetical protein
MILEDVHWSGIRRFVLSLSNLRGGHSYRVLGAGLWLPFDGPGDYWCESEVLVGFERVKSLH